MIFDWYIEHEYWFAAAQLSLAMLGMGATLKLADFMDVVREPKAVLVGIAIQLLMVPFVTWLAIQALNPVAGVLIGMALIAAIPGGTVSNIFTFLARGNVPLSISITSVTTLACLLTTPVILGFLINDYMPSDFEMPRGEMALEIGVFLLMPLATGMLCHAWLPRHAERISKFAVRGSLFVIVLIVIGASGAGRLDVDAFGDSNMLMITVYFALLIVVGALIPFLAGLSTKDTIAVEIEVAVRNTNLGLLIKASLFPAIAGQADPVGDFVLFTLLLYGGLQIIVGILWVWVRRRQMA